MFTVIGRYIAETFQVENAFFGFTVVKRSGILSGTPTNTLLLVSCKISGNSKPFNSVLKLTRVGDFVLKGHCHGHFFGFFSKTAPKLPLSTFNHAGNAPRTKREGYLANCLNKGVTVKSFHQFFQTTRTELEKVSLTFSS